MVPSRLIYSDLPWNSFTRKVSLISRSGFSLSWPVPSFPPVCFKKIHSHLQTGHWAIVTQMNSTECGCTECLRMQSKRRLRLVKPMELLQQYLVSFLLFISVASTLSQLAELHPTLGNVSHWSELCRRVDFFDSLLFHLWGNWSNDHGTTPCHPKEKIAHILGSKKSLFFLVDSI